MLQLIVAESECTWEPRENFADPEEGVTWKDHDSVVQWTKRKQRISQGREPPFDIDTWNKRRKARHDERLKTKPKPVPLKEMEAIMPAENKRLTVPIDKQRKLDAHETSRQVDILEEEEEEHQGDSVLEKKSRRLVSRKKLESMTPHMEPASDVARSFGAIVSNDHAEEQATVREALQSDNLFVPDGSHDDPGEAITPSDARRKRKRSLSPLHPQKRDARPYLNDDGRAAPTTLESSSTDSHLRRNKPVPILLSTSVSSQESFDSLFNSTTEAIRENRDVPTSSSVNGDMAPEPSANDASANGFPTSDWTPPTMTLSPLGPTEIQTAAPIVSTSNVPEAPKQDMIPQDMAKSIKGVPGSSEHSRLSLLPPLANVNLDSRKKSVARDNDNGSHTILQPAVTPVLAPTDQTSAPSRNTNVIPSSMSSTKATLGPSSADSRLITSPAGVSSAASLATRPHRLVIAPGTPTMTASMSTSTTNTKLPAVSHFASTIAQAAKSSLLPPSNVAPKSSRVIGPDILKNWGENRKRNVRKKLDPSSNTNNAHFDRIFVRQKIQNWANSEQAPDPNALQTFNPELGRFEDPRQPFPPASNRSDSDSLAGPSLSTRPPLELRTTANHKTPLPMIPARDQASRPPSNPVDSMTRKSLTCPHWKKGTCRIPEGTCPYSHMNTGYDVPKRKIVCSWWLDGRCKYTAEVCMFLHRNLTEQESSSEIRERSSRGSYYERQYGHRDHSPDMAGLRQNEIDSIREKRRTSGVTQLHIPTSSPPIHTAGKSREILESLPDPPPLQSRHEEGYPDTVAPNVHASIIDEVGDTNTDERGLVTGFKVSELAATFKINNLSAGTPSLLPLLLTFDLDSSPNKFVDIVGSQPEFTVQSMCLAEDFRQYSFTVRRIPPYYMLE